MNNTAAMCLGIAASWAWVAQLTESIASKRAIKKCARATMASTFKEGGIISQDSWWSDALLEESVRAYKAGERDSIPTYRLKDSPATTTQR